MARAGMKDCQITCFSCGGVNLPRTSTGQSTARPNLGLAMGQPAIRMVEQKTPLANQRGCENLKEDYFLRRNRSSEAPPRAARASVPGSGIGVAPNVKPFIKGAPVPNTALEGIEVPLPGVMVPTMDSPT